MNMRSASIQLSICAVLLCMHAIDAAPFDDHKVVDDWMEKSDDDCAPWCPHPPGGKGATRIGSHHTEHQNLINVVDSIDTFVDEFVEQNGLDRNDPTVQLALIQLKNTLDDFKLLILENGATMVYAGMDALLDAIMDHFGVGHMKPIMDGIAAAAKKDPKAGVSKFLNGAGLQKFHDAFCAATTSWIAPILGWILPTPANWLVYSAYKASPTGFNKMVCPMVQKVMCAGGAKLVTYTGKVASKPGASTGAKAGAKLIPVLVDGLCDVPQTSWASEFGSALGVGKKFETWAEAEKEGQRVKINAACVKKPPTDEKSAKKCAATGYNTMAAFAKAQGKNGSGQVKKPRL